MLSVSSQPWLAFHLLLVERRATMSCRDADSRVHAGSKEGEGGGQHQKKSDKKVKAKHR